MNIRKLNITLNNSNKSFYVDTSNNLLVQSGDIRSSTVPICLDNTVIDCVTECDSAVITDQLYNVIFNYDEESLTIDLSGDCETSVILIIDIDLVETFTLSGLSDDIFFGTSTFDNLLFTDIIDYINSQPSYQLTTNEITVRRYIQHCNVFAEDVHTFNVN